ncbi:FADH2 O2-dependent halogenase I [Glaciecola punicea ACAM 611]|jgi:tryptophan halogenase|uniref:FADH2 O2-dependent halogenase I n=1 Tax=Glaciecola punicea ACAM 611 TaxID=1121923 RepID=H5TD19_9ALTE|nr:tryptophan halogenase family protein [Glaciecola punicea]OFA30430.1 tryptophan halogenase [Glaciecola punicea]GAB56196.1 FADH2 O2-dependent halogenase I [Glaciecola punicea ACAM 611]
MDTEKKSKVVIVGGGSAGWMTAAALSHLLPRDRFAITLIESKTIGTVSVGEATIPSILEFNQMLGIDEAEFLSFTHGSFKLGIEFHDWYKKGHQYMHPFGPYGVNMNGIPFHHYWLKDKLQGKEDPLSDYCLEYQAALNNKFCHPQAQSRSAMANIKYAYHFDAVKYAEYLSAFSVKRGVNKIIAQITKVHQHAQTQDISSVALSNGELIEGDLFIDCSGFKGLLIAQTLKVGFEDWRQYLPCDSAIAQPSESLSTIKPYTISTAHECGWQWQIPLQHRIGNGFVFSSQFLSKDLAIDCLAKRLPSKALSEPRQLNWINGKRQQAWKNNCIAIGLSAGFIEPLESTGLQLIQSAIMRLLSLFPSGRCQQVDIDTYNRYTDDELWRIRDFIILHYKATQRNDSAFWRYCASMPIPDSLQNKIELYQSSGRIFRENNELFSEISWLSVMNGQGLVPKAYHPLVNNLSEQQRQQNLSHIAGAMREAEQQMPDHKAYLQKYCRVST